MHFLQPYRLMFKGESSNFLKKVAAVNIFEERNCKGN